MATWLITGGCGFIGTNLVRRLAAQPDTRIRVVDNLTVGSRAALDRVAGYTEVGVDRPAGATAPIELVEADIRDRDRLAAAVQGADIIVHLAANTGVAPSLADPSGDCATNVIGTLNALEAARHAGVFRFVFASSGAPAGSVTPPIDENVAPRPLSPYGASKLAGEGYCSAYWGSFGLETVALRFGNVYGPLAGHKTSVVAKFIRDARATGQLTVYGDGTQTRDLVYVEDLCRAIELAARAPGVGGELFQIATNTETSINALADLLRPRLEAWLGHTVTVAYDAPRTGDVARNYSDTRKAARLLGWSPEFDLAAGLEATLASFLPSPAGQEARA